MLRKESVPHLSGAEMIFAISLRRERNGMERAIIG